MLFDNLAPAKTLQRAQLDAFAEESKKKASQPVPVDVFFAKRGTTIPPYIGTNMPEGWEEVQVWQIKTGEPSKWYHLAFWSDLFRKNENGPIVDWSTAAKEAHCLADILTRQHSVASGVVFADFCEEEGYATLKLLALMDPECATKAQEAAKKTGKKKSKDGKKKEKEKKKSKDSETGPSDSIISPQNNADYEDYEGEVDLEFPPIPEGAVQFPENPPEEN